MILKMIWAQLTNRNEAVSGYTKTIKCVWMDVERSGCRLIWGNVVQPRVTQANHIKCKSEYPASRSLRMKLLFRNCS